MLTVFKILQSYPYFLVALIHKKPFKHWGNIIFLLHRKWSINLLLSISSVCKCVYVCVAAVEACVLHGLKRRAAGFLRSNKIAALFTKVGKGFPPAEELCRKAQELELVFESKWDQTLRYPPIQHTTETLSKYVQYINCVWNLKTCNVFAFWSIFFFKFLHLIDITNICALQAKYQ